MRTAYVQRSSLAVLLCLLCSCSSNSYWSIDSYGATPLLGEELQTVDICALLAPDTPAWAAETPEKRLSLALRRFYARGTPAEQATRRNGIQERMLIASNQAAAAFERALKRHDVTWNFTLGSLTTALAGLGSIFTPASTVRALAGSAAILSGVRAEWNDALFNNLTIQLLVKGMHARRDRIYAGIRSRRNDASITAYTVEEAIKDAVEYHNAFSILAGLEESALAIERSTNPGVRELEKMLAFSARLRTALEGAPALPTTTDGEGIAARLQAQLESFAPDIPEVERLRTARLAALNAILALDPAMVAQRQPLQGAVEAIQSSAAALIAGLRAARGEVSAFAARGEEARTALALGVLNYRTSSPAEAAAERDKLRVIEARLLLLHDEVGNLVAAAREELAPLHEHFAEALRAGTSAARASLVSAAATLERWALELDTKRGQLPDTRDALEGRVATVAPMFSALQEAMRIVDPEWRSPSIQSFQAALLRARKALAAAADK